METKQYFDVNKVTLIVLETIFSFNDFKTKDSYLKLASRMYVMATAERIYPKHIVDAFESAMLLIDYMSEGDCRELRNIYVY